MIVQQVMNWLVLASIYTLLAIGFSLLFGVLDIVHFSHGDVSLIAPFVALGVFQALLASAVGLDSGLMLLLACLIAVAAIGGLGVVIEKVVIRPFANAPSLMVLVTTVALGIVLRELIRHVFPEGSNPHAFPSPLGATALWLAGVPVSWFVLLDLGLTLLLLIAIFAFLRFTPLGICIRAVAQDREAAMMMGIDAAKTFRATFFVASAIGAIAGLFFATHVGVVRFDFGILAGLMGFSAAVVGGLGSIFGAVIGGLLLGGIETIAQAVVPGGTAYRQVFAFLLVILFLVFKPSGILGRQVVEKV
jgi:branched-subunit amino acid ABC-type transport system permease component